MAIQMWMCGLLVLVSRLPSAEALSMYDPQLCYILDGFLGLYGLIITGMFIKEKFFRHKLKGTDEGIYSDLKNPDNDTYEPLTRDAERGRNRRPVDNDSTYTGLTKRTEPEYKELPVKRGERHRKNEQIYQGLTSASRDTYDSLQMQPLPSR